jgi:uncharacterized protein YkwD
MALNNIFASSLDSLNRDLRERLLAYEESYYVAETSKEIIFKSTIASPTSSTFINALSASQQAILNDPLWTSMCVSTAATTAASNNVYWVIVFMRR